MKMKKITTNKMITRKLKNWTIGTLTGLAAILSNSSCAQISGLNTSENPTEGRQLTVYEGDVRDWTEIDSFKVGSPYNSSPIGAIVTSMNNGDNALPPFDTRLICEQITDAKKDCAIEVKDNDINNYTNGNVWTIRVDPAPTGFAVNQENLELTWMYGPSPNGVLEVLTNNNNGDNGGNDNSGNGGVSCDTHSDCHGFGNYQCVGDSVHDDFYACVNGACSDVALAFGQFKEWCPNGCEDGACLPEPNGDDDNENGGTLECMANSDCGTNKETLYCVGDYDVYKDTESFACVDGNCVDNSSYEQWQEWCQDGCKDGACVQIYQPTALERLVAFNSNFQRPEADGKSDIR